MKRIPTLAIVLSVAATLAAPASAGGQISFGFYASNRQETNAVQTALALYSLSRDVDGSAAIFQNGHGNAAALGQFGHGNFGVIEQNGNNHDAALSQSGHGNSFGIFQSGVGTSAQVNQNGNQGAGLLFQYGW